MSLEDFMSMLLNRFLTTPTVPEAGLAIGRTVAPPHYQVVLPDRSRCEHTVIVGKTGSGKTHLLEWIAVQLARRGEGFALFDFHGDVSLSLVNRLLDVRYVDDRLVILDPSHPTRSPGVNVLEAGANEADRFRKVSEISSILRQRWGVESFGARTEELLRNSLYTLAANNRTLADLPKLLTDTVLRRNLTQYIEHPDIQAYWRDRYEPLSEPMKAAFREPLLNRVTAFLTEPAARHLLGQPVSTIDISHVIEKQQWLIVRLPKGRLRDHAHTLGNLLFAQLQFAALAREQIPLAQRRPFTLLLDEVQNLAENDLAILLSEGRKFGIAILTANQFWEQLPKSLRGALLSASSHICFSVSSADANILAAELSLERRSRLTLDLTNLPRGQAIGRFGNQGVVRFGVPPLPETNPLDSAKVERIIEPVTRLRNDVERLLRISPQQPTEHSIAGGAGVQEGQDDW